MLTNINHFIFNIHIHYNYYTTTTHKIHETHEILTLALRVCVQLLHKNRHFIFLHFLTKIVRFKIDFCISFQRNEIKERKKHTFIIKCSYWLAATLWHSRKLFAHVYAENGVFVLYFLHTILTWNEVRHCKIIAFKDIWN